MDATYTQLKDSPARRAEYQELVKRFTPEGSRLYVNVNNFTRNGTRYLDVYVVTDEQRITRITALVAWATGYRYDDRREAIRTQNSELDVVRALARALYGDERALEGERL